MYEIASINELVVFIGFSTPDSLYYYTKRIRAPPPPFYIYKYNKRLTSY